MPGAVTKGQRQRGRRGLFLANDNLESVYARDTLRRKTSDTHNSELKPPAVGPLREPYIGVSSAFGAGHLKRR
jgi:hypothetical protein